MSKTYCFLVPNTKEDSIRKYYLPYFNEEECLFIPLYFDNNKKKTSVTDMKLFLNEEVFPIIKEYNCKYLLICNSDYFKYLAKTTKVDYNLGYIIPYQNIFISYVPSYESIFYKGESVKTKIKQALEAVVNHAQGCYKELGRDIIKVAQYPSTVSEIASCMSNLHAYTKITCDIETWSLKHYDSGITSITFCWNEHEGCAFLVDTSRNERNEPVRDILRQFFESYKGTLIFHNITFDVYILIYQLYMNNLLDTKGLLKGLEVFLHNFEDTKLIAYLATNSCSGNTLGLKALAQEYAGNYAEEEIGNIDAINRFELLRYNLIDGLCTWYVFNKYFSKMKEDKQERIYETVFKPAVRDIIQMQLTGMPLDMEKVVEVEKELTSLKEDALKRITSSSLVQEFNERYKITWAEERNKKLKRKRVTPEDCPIIFNPDSNTMLRVLLYEVIGLPIIEYTDTKQAATGKDTLAKLIQHTSNTEVQELLQALIDYKDVIKILTAFIPAFRHAIGSNTGIHYLFGNFNLGGCVSARLSSSCPNMQNLPATGSKFAKLIKSCFKAPNGWLLIGLDFSSLEDHISALVTKDPNKLKVYTDHYDGHALRAYSYFKDKMPDITKELEEHPNNQIEIINSIKEKHKDLRQASKAPTFALTYQGTWQTLQKNCGFTIEEAQRIEKAYHDLYQVSDKYVKKAIERAGKDGYVTGAFGLRVRTPLLYNTVRGLRTTPKEAEAEARTAGNAIFQSWCLLNLRAASEVMNQIRNSKYREDIRICCSIHDATYYLVRDDIDLLIWFNNILIKAVEWQDDPIIYHPEVGLGGELSIFYPDWSHEIIVPNYCTKEQLIKIVDSSNS